MHFLPFISDLALHGEMKSVFTVVTLLCGITLGSVGLPSIISARHCLMDIAELSSIWRVINNLLSACGICVIIGVLTLSFVPWDCIFWPHIVCAGIIFGGGFWWVIGSAVLSYRFMAAEKWVLHWNAHAGFRKGQFVVVIVLFCNGLFALFSFCAAVLDDPSMFRLSTLPSEVGIAHDHFQEYCEARGGWHEEPWVNWVALSEWLYFFCLIAGVVTSTADVYSCNAANGVLSEKLLKT